MDKENHLYLLNEIGRHLASGMQFVELAGLSVKLISERFGYPVVEVWISDGGRQLSLLSDANRLDPLAADGNTALGDKGLFVEALRTGQTIWVTDVSDEPRHFKRFAGTQSALSIPIISRGTAQGVLHIESLTSQPFHREDVTAMETVTSLLSHAMHGLHLLEQAKRSEEYLQAVLKASQDIAIISTDRQGYTITCSEGSERIFGYQPLEMRGRDILTLYTEESLVRGINDFLNGVTTDEIFKKDITELRRGDQHLFLNLRLHKVRNFRSSIIGFLAITRDITETVRMERKLLEMSVTDELTGLFNQREFFNLLQREIEKFKRSQRPLSLCFFDLDKFKQYNDTYGHLEGDGVLKKVAEFIRKSIRQHLDLAFRYGGDEFTIIMSEVVPQKASLIAERIRSAVQEHFKKGITLSIGIAPFYAGLNLRQFVQTADQAMYQAKTKGGNRIVAL